MLCFQISLLLFKSILFRHHLRTCRRVEESHVWQLASSGRLDAFPGGNHPSIPTALTFRDASHWCSVLLSYPPAMPFLQRLKPEARHWCQGFNLFQFLSGTAGFEEHSCGSCQAPFQGKRFRWLHSLCLCQTFTFLLTTQDSSVTGGSTGRRAWPLLPGHSYMAQGMEQLRKD